MISPQHVPLKLHNCLVECVRENSERRERDLLSLESINKNTDYKLYDEPHDVDKELIQCLTAVQKKPNDSNTSQPSEEEKKGQPS